jgi:hypothetical protein
MHLIQLIKFCGRLERYSMLRLVLGLALAFVFSSVVSAQSIRNDGVPRKEYQEMKKQERIATNKVVQKGIDARLERKYRLWLERAYRNAQINITPRITHFYVPPVYNPWMQPRCNPRIRRGVFFRRW